MAEASIPVDLFNPGQVFACLGFLEAADVLLGEAEGAFDWSDEANVKFRLRTSGEGNPFAAVLKFVAAAEVFSIAPAHAKQSTKKWDIPISFLKEGAPFPFPLPLTPATLPAGLEVIAQPAIVVNHWGEDARQTKRDAVKFWAGSGGYPGSALMRDAIDLIRDRVDNVAIENPFALSAPQSNSFRFDWRRDYIPIDVGFSPNNQGTVIMRGFPLVEIFAAIGLENARPKKIRKLDYRYGVVAASGMHVLLNPILLRASLGAAELPFPRRVFRMSLGWPGQENQARCITGVTEELYS